MPLKWFQALERPGADTGEFLDAAYLANFRIRPPRPGQTLPIGFAVDRQDDSKFVRTNLHWLKDVDPKTEKVDWVGLNCAACHTGRRSCFYRAVTAGDGGARLSFVDADLVFDPDKVYR